LVPAVVGTVRVYAPAVAGARKPVEPDVDPSRAIAPLMAGVVKVGVLLRTRLPVPVLVPVPVPPLAGGSTPVTPVVSGRPVALVRVTEAGTPSTGVTRVGLVPRTFAPLPVLVVTPVPPADAGRVPEATVVVPVA
jgi:hypothetical protein